MTTATIHVGDVFDVLRTLPDASAQCVVTSPPYWGLRSYGAWRMQTVWGSLDDFAPPRRGNKRRYWLLRLKWRANERGGIWSPNGKTWIGALGLEPTPELFVEHLVEVFREVRRVLRDDGTCWVNLGDSYTSGGRADFGPDNPCDKQHTQNAVKGAKRAAQPPGLKPKDLIGIPWRVAFALQADGWYLRSDIIWAKPNPMPESVTDRPTKAHEYVFLLTKRSRYYYDADAVREAAEYGRSEEIGGFKIWNRSGVPTEPGRTPGTRSIPGDGGTRNLRDVWMIPTQAFLKAHFATFPERLVEPCIKAGTSERGACPQCGAGWRRVVEREVTKVRPPEGGVLAAANRAKAIQPGMGNNVGANSLRDGFREGYNRTTGWQPVCSCCVWEERDDARPGHGPHKVLVKGKHAEPVPAVVLDPFSGAGTTGLVAAKLGRDYVGIELNPTYAELSRDRIHAACGLMCEVEVRQNSACQSAGSGG